MDSLELIAIIETHIQSELEKRFLDVPFTAEVFKQMQVIIKSVCAQYTDEDGWDEFEVIVTPNLTVMVLEPDEYQDYKKS